MSFQKLFGNKFTIALILNNSYTFNILKSLINRNKLPQSILLYGKELNFIKKVCYKLAGDLLKIKKNIIKHPDFFIVYPKNKMQQIDIDRIRDLINRVKKTSNQGVCKITVIFEADRLNLSASNAFLKILEEPPAHTYIFLVTIYKEKLLKTIQSRCYHFYLPKKISNNCKALQWEEWLKNYQFWLNSIENQHNNFSANSEIMFQLYGLVNNFSKYLSDLNKKIKYDQMLLKNNIEKEEIVIANTLHRRTKKELFMDIIEETRAFAYSKLNSNSSQRRVSFLIYSFKMINECINLMESNLSELDLLEKFLLNSLFFWSQ